LRLWEGRERVPVLVAAAAEAAEAAEAADVTAGLLSLGEEPAPEPKPPGPAPAASNATGAPGATGDAELALWTEAGRWECLFFVTRPP
jgi:hypothetical protein